MKPVRLMETTLSLDDLTARYKTALRDGNVRFAVRLHAVILNLEGRTAPDIASILKVHRSKVSLWLRRYESGGCAGLEDRPKSGRPPRVTAEHRDALRGLVAVPPSAHGLPFERWTLRLVAEVMKNRFGVTLHPAHWSRILRSLPPAAQSPDTVAQAA
jgi:transposase